MKKSDETQAWLNSPSAQELRAFYGRKATEQANLLMAAGLTSTDPKIVAHAAAFAAWTEAHKELDPKHDPD